MRQNRSTVGHAPTFVGARTDQAGDFVRANFGVRSRHSVTQSIADKYKREDIYNGDIAGRRAPLSYDSSPSIASNSSAGDAPAFGGTLIVRPPPRAFV